MLQLRDVVIGPASLAALTALLVWVIYRTARLLNRRSHSRVKDESKPELYPHLDTYAPFRRTAAGLDHLPNAEKHEPITPTGFTKAEIQSIGSFPDYSVLSGFPHPEPCRDFNIKTASFRPFRPFRWAYHQTMSLKKLAPNFWIELEQNYFERMDQRHELRRNHPDNVLKYSLGTELACRELMEMVLQYVCIRYPQYFALVNGNTEIQNKLLNTTTKVDTMHPLEVLFENIPEDFAIMMRNGETGFYHLRAGITCSAMGWNIGTMIGSSLQEIHTHVGDYKEKMLKSMDRYFAKMPCNEPINRGSWSVEDWKLLFLQKHDMDKRSAFSHLRDEARDADNLHLRVDWQTLRRLPLSGAMVFNFKAVFTPLQELRHEPFIPALMHKQLSEGRKHLVTWRTDSSNWKMLLETLARWKEEQIKKGIVPKDWEVSTLDDTPFYPGWERVWHEKQGF